MLTLTVEMGRDAFLYDSLILGAGSIVNGKLVGDAAAGARGSGLQPLAETGDARKSPRRPAPKSAATMHIAG